MTSSRMRRVDEAVRAMGLTRIIERPGMVADPRALPDVAPPEGFDVRPVAGPDDDAGLRHGRYRHP